MTLLALVDSASLWPFAVLAICVGVIVLLITKLRVHPFLALIAAAFLAGSLRQNLPRRKSTDCRQHSGRTPM